MDVVCADSPLQNQKPVLVANAAAADQKELHLRGDLVRGAELRRRVRSALSSIASIQHRGDAIVRGSFYKSLQPSCAALAGGGGAREDDEVLPADW